jgi:hypothetical protein
MVIMDAYDTEVNVKMTVIYILPATTEITAVFEDL